MAKKKTVTKSKLKSKPVKAAKAVASKASTKSADKAKKPASKGGGLASSVVKLASKMVKSLKSGKSEKVVKAEKVKAVVAKAVKPAKSEKPKAKQTAKDAGSTLIEMAKQEMAAVKIGQTSDKAEKVSKFKPIKVERGNAADEKAKWLELNKRYGKEKASTYKMIEVYESLRPIQHKVLGWGFVLTNENDRLEVLFENGIKMLISNYKPN